MILTSFMIALNGLIVLASCYLMYHPRKSKPSDKLPCFRPYAPPPLPFETPSYLDRMEKAHLNLLRERQPVDWTITLWLGLDGLRIDPDGTSEWIKRSRPAPLHRAVGGSGAVWDPDILALSGPLPTYRLPTPPPPGVSVLYADGRIIEMAAPIDPTMAIQAQMDKLRTENAVMSMQQQLQQTCVTPPIYTGCFPYLQTCMTPPLYPGFMPYPQYKI